MGVANAVIQGFSSEFLQGMTEPSRSRRLGDIGKSDPRSWFWGTGSKVPHLLVMALAKKNVAAFEETVRKPPWDDAFETISTLSTSNMGLTEPFGFRDGLSQPEFDWDRAQPAQATALFYKNQVALGELLLGYPNEYDKYTDRPLLEASAEGADQLLAAEDHPGKKDLGRNGTYLVLRHLEQDVRGFWRYLDGAASGDAAPDGLRAHGHRTGGGALGLRSLRRGDGGWTHLRARCRGHEGHDRIAAHRP